MKMSILFPCLLVFITSSVSYGSADISPYLQDKMLEAMEDNRPLPVMVIFKDQVDIIELDQRLYEENASVEKRVYTVITALQEKANNTQIDLLDYLSACSQDEIHSFQPYWIINAIEVNAIPAILIEISKRNDVASLDYNYKSEPILPVSEQPAPERVVDSAEPGLKYVNAHKLWELGYSGAGTIVMNRDSGVDGNHPALSARWRGTHVPYNQAWLGPGTFPTDGGSSGHGTHTMGTITGMDPLTNDTIGVAPGAEWIAANYVNSYAASFQWAMDPDGNPSTTDDMPCVISNSTYIGSVPPGSCLASTYAALFNSVEAVGIAIVWSAGNEGPGAQSITSPKNINTNLVNAFATGALNGGVPSLPIANFSSRGPSGCGGTGSLLIKPEASAPGVNVRSAVPGGYGLKSGTSMACPHVAGAISLLKEAFPNRTGHEIKLALYFGASETSADLFSNDPGEPAGQTSGEDHTYGMGVIDVFRAYEFLLLGYPPESPANFQAFSDFTMPNSIQLTWSDPTSLVTGDPLNINDFHIYIERDSILIDSVSGGVEQFVDAGLNDGQEYHYAIYGSLDSTGIKSAKVQATWISGGSPIPRSPVIIAVNVNNNDVTLHWMNPSRNIDDTRMDDFAGIRLHQDNSLVTTFTRTSADTGRLDS
ncbi:MAG: S8 family serine peptidase, partial [Calditrichia bacterium]|nr:S8 family serine peptidase [Calditrichia bacterium]